MHKTFFKLAFALLLFAFPLASEANWFAGVGGAVGYNSGFYNPAFGYGLGAVPGVSPWWGGGYNLNSLSGGGWGGYPAGYGFTNVGGVGFGAPAGIGGVGGACPGGGGALTGGFGGFYSPFVGGY